MNRRSASKRSSPFLLRRFGREVSIACASCIALGSLSSGKASDPANNPSLSEKVAASIRSLAQNQSKAIVRIRCADGHGEINGTGFYIDPSGMICTLGEMVRGADLVSILQDGTWHAATVVAIDPRSGVAFLKSQSTNSPSVDASFIDPGEITTISPQTPVVGIGFPYNGEATASLGMIIGTETHAGENFFCVPHHLASIPMVQGEGGSPVLSLSGSLLGMVISGDSQTGSCWILPASAIQKLHHDLLCYGKLNPGWIGAVVEEAAVPQGNSRTRVVSVQQGSPAEASGILPGDMILSIAGRGVPTPEEVPAATFYLNGGKTVEITLLRKEKLKKINVTCGETAETIGNLGSTQTASLDSGTPSK